MGEWQGTIGSVLLAVTGDALWHAIHSNVLLMVY